MENKEIILLNEAPPELVDYVAKIKKTEAIIYKCAYVHEVDLSGFPNPPKLISVKKCECHCTACGTEFYADYCKSQACNSHLGSVIGFIHPEINESTYDRENTLCPYCGAEVKAIHVNTFGNRTELVLNEDYYLIIKQICGEAALMRWVTFYKTDKQGRTKTEIMPYEAYVTSGKKLIKFVGYFKNFTSLTMLGHWERRKRCDYLPGRIDKNHILPLSDDELKGTAAENSKLELYTKQSSCLPELYLAAYIKKPNIENLITSGAGYLIDSGAERANYYFNCYKASELLKKFDLRKAKPHEIVRLTKPEYKFAIKNRWDLKDIDKYKELNYLDSKIGLVEYNEIKDKYNGIYFYAERIAEETTLYDALKYFRRQSGNDVQMLVDYWDFAYKLGINLDTDELRLPKNLHRRHDELAEQWDYMNKKSERERTAAGFEANSEKYAALAYSDGELCIFVCPNYEELRREGRVLRHCVGGYAKSHISGKDVIFFVRHARRPERPYYTLDIRFTEKEPYEVQLHGYGNERHGENKQYSHSIPKKVRDFCDKWEAEILMPWHNAENNKKKARKDKNGKSNKSNRAVA